MAFEIIDGILTKYIPEKEHESIVINNVCAIGQGAFKSADIKSVTISGKITRIDFRAFQDCKHLEEVVIHDEVENLHNFVFAGCTSLKKVTLPAGIRYIGKWMFQNCTSLESINLPGSIERIADNAFEGCINLKSVEIPDSVSYIGTKAFAGCVSLERVSIGNGLNFIWNQAFEGCSSLREIEISEENKTFQSIDGIIFTDNKATLKLAPQGLSGHFSIPEGTKKIDSNAFDGCAKLTSVSFPESLEEIEYRAFFDCDGLTEISIPANVTQIGCEAFGKTSWKKPTPKALQRISIDPSAGAIQISDDIFYFSGTDPLVYPELPIKFVSDRDTKRLLGLGFCLNPDKYGDNYKNDYLKYVKSQKKYLLELAKKINLPEVEEFYSALDNTETKKNTTKKTAAQKPKSDSVDAKKAPTVADMRKIWRFDTIIFDETYTGTVTLKGIEIKKYKGNDANVEIPSFIGKTPVYSIAAEAFSGNQSIVSVTIPESVLNIGDIAFLKCNNLRSVKISGEKINIGSSVFRGCTNLESVTLAAKTVSVGSLSFWGCEKIMDENGLVILDYNGGKILCDCNRPITSEEITVPEGVTKIDGHAFKQTVLLYPDDVLKSVILPKSLKEIGSCAFCDAIALQSILIPGGVESIGQLAFSGCTSLSEIHIPSSVSFIGGCAFLRCPSLTVYAAKGSFAEKYASDNGIKFVEE